MIIVGLAAAVLLGGLAVSIIGRRQVSDKADDLRQATSTAIVEPGLISIAAYATQSDPVTQALGSDRVVSLQQQMDSRWCVETEVSALLSSATAFWIDDDGQFVETQNCR